MADTTHKFDVQGALDAGASEDQVLDYLSKQSPDFNVQDATKAGASKRQVIDYLSSNAQPPAKVILGDLMSGKKHNQGLQPQKGEDPNLNSDWTDTAMKGAATTGTIGAAAAMMPASVIPGVTTALRAGAAGLAGGGIDAALGGHPVRTGLETAAGSMALENPATAKLLKFVTSPAKKLILETLFGGEKAAAPETSQGASLLKKQLMKYGGSVDPGYSPPSGPANVSVASEVPEPWNPKKVNYATSPGTGQPNLPAFPGARVGSGPTETPIEDVKTSLLRKMLQKYTPSDEASGVARPGANVKNQNYEIKKVGGKKVIRNPKTGKFEAAED